jgi:hypothetical protein
MLSHVPCCQAFKLQLGTLDSGRRIFHSALHLRYSSEATTSFLKNCTRVSTYSPVREKKLFGSTVVEPAGPVLRLRECSLGMTWSIILETNIETRCDSSIMYVPLQQQTNIETRVARNAHHRSVLSLISGVIFYIPNDAC